MHTVCVVGAVGLPTVGNFNQIYCNKKSFKHVSLGAFDVEKVLQHAVVRLVCYACHFSFLVCVEKFDFRFPEIFSIFG